MKTSTKALLSAVAAAAVVSSAHAMEMDSCVAYQLSCSADDVLMMTHHATPMCTDEAMGNLHPASNMAGFVCQPFDEAYLDTGCNAVTCSLQFTCVGGTVTNHLYQSADCIGTPLHTMDLAANSPGDCFVSEGCGEDSDSDSDEHTASPTVTDPSIDADGRNGIMRAAMSGDQTDMTTALADAAQFIDLMDNSKLGYNALMLAAQYDHQDVARMLLDAGAITCPLTETDSSEENNWSNVMVAAWYGDEEIMKMFLTASTEHLDTVCDYYHMTPLHAAVSLGHSRTTSVLTSFGANVNALDSDNMTPLHYAVKSGHFKCAKTLLAAGAHKHLVDDEDNTACDYAAEAAEGVRAFGEVKGNISHDIQALLGSCAVPP